MGNEITIAREIKYLGIHIDRRLTFGSHVDLTVSRARKQIGLMRSYCGNRLSWKSKLSLYSTVVEPLLLYGAGAWGDAAAVTNRRDETR